MTALFFVLLLFIFYHALKNTGSLVFKLYAIFLLLWVAFFIPHLIRHINIQL